MNEPNKPELTHEISNYGCTIKHSFCCERAVLIDRDGHEQEFAENLGMIAQGAPNALLLALHAAKKDEAARAEAKAQERRDDAAAKKAASVASPVSPADAVVVDSPITPAKKARGN